MTTKLLSGKITVAVDELSAGVAQLVEQLICNQQVGGSSPSTSSIVTGRKLNMEEFPSGQRGQTVNLLLNASVVRIHPPPPGRSKLIACSDFFCLVHLPFHPTVKAGTPHVRALFRSGPAGAIAFAASAAMARFKPAETADPAAVNRTYVLFHAHHSTFLPPASIQLRKIIELLFYKKSQTWDRSSKKSRRPEWSGRRLFDSIFRIPRCPPCAGGAERRGCCPRR